MINHLPPELIHQIIESAIPSGIHCATYAERQSNLQSFCLVSKYLYQVAGPLLFRFILANRSPRTVNRALVVAQSKRWTGYIQQVSIECSGHRDRFPIKPVFDRLTRNGSGLRVLTLAFLKVDISVALLEHLPQLQQIRLFGGSFKLSTPLLLPMLESLTMDHDSAHTLSIILSPTVLPALRILALPHTNEKNFRQLRRSGIVELSGQLDATFWATPHQKRTHKRTNYFPASSFRRTLFDSWEFSGPNFPRWQQMVYHLRIRGRPSTRELIRLNAGIQRGELRLKSLYLSPSYQSRAQETKEGARLWKKLWKTCQSMGIDVIFEELDAGWAGSYISEEFCRRQRELRKVEATSAAEVQG
ncbi:hypothetical protein JCM5353_005778 [Sporobolomyces roseus]